MANGKSESAEGGLAGGRLIVLAVAAGQLCLTLFLSAKLNISLDEAWSLHTSARTLGYAASQAVWFETQAPLYFVLLAAWRALDDGVFFARLFSVLCAALAVVVMAAVSRRYVKWVHPGFVAAAVATHPLMIYAATEIRLYALLALICSLLLLLFHDGYVAERPSRRAAYCYLALAVVGLYTQYYVGFLLVAGACGLLATGRWQPLKRYLIGMAAVGACFAPLMKVALDQRASYAQGITQKYSLLESAKVILWRVQELLLPLWWLEYGKWQAVGLAVFAGVAVALLVRNRFSRVTRVELTVWTTAAVLAACFTVLVRLTHFDMALARHAIPLFLAALLAAFAALSAARSRAALAAFAVVTLGLNAAFVYAQFRPLVKNGDYARVAAYLMAEEKSGQPILIYHGMSDIALGQYYRGANRIVPLPQANTYEHYRVQDFALKDDAQLEEVFQRASGEGGQLWLVEDFFCGEFGIDFNCGLLDRYVTRHYTVEASRDFFRARVRRLRRK
jgi:hypothetical protein